MLINQEWHEKNRMPKNPAKEQRIKWHEGYAKNCQCRDSKAILQKLKQPK
jgi:hypothetical protein